MNELSGERGVLVEVALTTTRLGADAVILQGLLSMQEGDDVCEE